MSLQKIIVGILDANCYIIEINNHLYIIDPGDDYQRIINMIGNKDIYSILVTHHHGDHIGALDYLENNYNIKHNTNIDDFEVIKTSGHTNDSISFYNKEHKLLFCGDFLFKRSFGRTDLGGNNLDMKNSIELISSLPDDTILLPGHGESSTLMEEKKYFSLYKKTL